MQITAIITVPTVPLMEAAEEIQREYGIDIPMHFHYPQDIDAHGYDTASLRRHLEEADVIFLDIRGQGRAVEIALETLRDRDALIINFMGPASPLMEITRLGAFSGRDFIKNMAKMADGMKPFDEQTDDERKGMREQIRSIQKKIESMGSSSRVPALADAAHFIRITRYYAASGRENYKNMLILLLSQYFGHTSLPTAGDPVDYPDYGIYHPDYGYFSEKNAYYTQRGYKKDHPTIGILFYGGMHRDQNIPTIRALEKHLGGIQILPVYADGLSNLTAIQEFFLGEGTPSVDAVINLMWFRLNGGPMGGSPEATTTLLGRLNVPVFAPACMFSQEIDEWKDDPAGMNHIMSLMAVVWPELDGCIEPIPCCGVQPVMVGTTEVREVTAIDDRIARIAGRVQNWIRLKNLDNSQKRVALIVYNYPPGEESIAGAAYLDVFQSVHKLLTRLKAEGYTVDMPDRPLHELFEERGLVNSGRWFAPNKTAEQSFSLSQEDYKSYFESLPQPVVDEVNRYWGAAPGDVMVHHGSFILPGIECGNILVAMQPARPPLGDQDLSEASHDRKKPPHHQYLAYYWWMREHWNADMIIHVGTHGLAEFTSGKEIGMSENCFPDILIGNIPHLYFYHVLNTSEASIARRRLYGTLISYNSPPYATADLYDRYLELEDLIDEYEEAMRLDQTIRRERIESKFAAVAKELNLSGGSVSDVHLELYEMKRRIIPKGLHVLGETYTHEDIASFLSFLLRYDRGEIKSLNRIMAERRGYDYDAMIHDRRAFTRDLEAIEADCSRVIRSLLQTPVDEVLISEGIMEGGEDLRSTLTFGRRLAAAYADNGGELSGCLNGLATGFIEPRLGGDVIRTPDVLPTGCNINQFDPTKIPTSTAAERGAEIAENTIQTAYSRDGIYPQSIGIVLWGFETTKTGGETIGQILSYLGVRISKKAGSWYPELEVIPLETLGRPRIDCFVTICGFFRDMFPNLIQLLSQAFSLVSDLDEPPEMNYVRKHTLENLASLRSGTGEGVTDPEAAQKIASGRIYGPRTGEYGTRMLGFMEDSVWNEEQELADIYIDSMNYLYTGDLHPRKETNVYRQNLSHVDLISQVRDSHDYEITDLDHYFEFFGGLSQAVETVSGRRAPILISDTTEEIIVTEDVAASIARGTRTRLLNPKWIDGMLEHEYHGAQVISDRIYNALGLAATTGFVDTWVWSSIAERFIFDEEMRRRLIENNAFATAGIIERLLEAEQRGYWEASEEELDKLRDAYLDLEGSIEEKL